MMRILELMASHETPAPTYCLVSNTTQTAAADDDGGCGGFFGGVSRYDYDKINVT